MHRFDDLAGFAGSNSALFIYIRYIVALLVDAISRYVRPLEGPPRVGHSNGTALVIGE